VRFADRLAAVCISIGGVGTILAVSAVFLFLVSVVVPLFTRGKAEPAASVVLDSADRARRAFFVGTDEYRVAGWTLDSDGVVRVFRADNGESIDTLRVAAADSLTAASFDVASRSFALGMVDGTIRFGRVVFRSDFPDASSLPEEAATLAAGATLVVDGAIVERTSNGAFRRQARRGAPPRPHHHGFRLPLRRGGRERHRGGLPRRPQRQRIHRRGFADHASRCDSA
jgi:phosphate transport system permease protein